MKVLKRVIAVLLLILVIFIVDYAIYTANFITVGGVMSG